MPLVAMPDGAQVQFPDDMPPDQIRGMIATKFPDASKQTFLDKIGGDVSSRWQQGQQDVHNYPAMAPIVGLGVATGAANDVAGAVTNAVIPDVVKQGLKTGADATAGALDNTSIGQGIGDKLLAAKTAYDNFMQNNPKSAIALRTAGNVASFIPTERAVEAGVSAIPGAIDTVGNAIAPIENASQKLPGLLGDVSSGVEKPVTFSPEALETGAKLRYSNAEQMGGVIKPEGFQDTLNAIKQKVGYQTPEGMAFAGENTVTDTINKLDKMQQMPISLSGLDEIDGQLNSKISVAMRSGDNEAASKLMQIKGMLKNASTTVQPADLVNPQAFDEWRAGDQLWTAKSKMQQLQRIMDNAENYSGNPDTAMRTGYRTLARQLAKNPQGWTPDEIALINKASQMSLPAAALKTLGGRLMAGFVGGIGGAAGGGIPGAFGGMAVGEAVGYPLRVAGNALAKGRAMAPFNAVASRPNVIAAIPQSIADIAKLPMAQQQAAFDALLKGAIIKP